MERVRQLVDAEDWRADKREAWSAMLEVLVQGMDWETGVIAGVTRSQLAERAAVSPRTATSLLGWARGAGLLVMVETGASAAFLGTEKNRAASFVVTVPREWRAPAPVRPVDAPVDESCYPPVSHVEQESPSADRGLKIKRRQDDRPGGARPPWPLHLAPTTAADRSAAAATFCDRAGLSRVPRFRATAMLSGWFVAGWSVAALLHAVDHHPDHARGRGDAVRSARNPLAVIGHRLGPWRGRHNDLPGVLRAPEQRESDAAIRSRRAERATRRANAATAGAGARADIARVLDLRRTAR